MLKPLAIVTPWFGAELHGGAEQIAFQLAVRLAARGHQIEVLTTCCRSFQDDWATNHLAPGESVEQGIVIRRFQVDARAKERFEEVNQELLACECAQLRPGVNPTTRARAEIFVDENINSRELLDYLDLRGDEYHAFIFLPYLYGLTLKGLPKVAARSFLQPCLHDESYAYLPVVEQVAHAAQGLLFNSRGEMQLALKLFGPGIYLKSFIVGLGIEPLAVTPYGVTLPPALVGAKFVLCLGRKDKTKNTDLVVCAYRRFRDAHSASQLKLVLAGPGPTPFMSHVDGLLDLGLVSDETKASLLKQCTALFQPSRNESYSRVMMEAWHYARPVGVHRHCLATAAAVEESSGGWTAATEEEWAELFAVIDTAEVADFDRLGARGQAYAATYADWEGVIDRYEEVFLGDNTSQLNSPSVDRMPASVHQLLPNLAYGDAISIQAIEIRDRLRALGYGSEIFVKQLGESIEHEGHTFTPHSLNDRDWLIYHHSISSEVTAFASKHHGPKCLVYHNITPASYFEPYRPGFAWMLDVGRQELRRLSKSFQISVGVSDYNAAELAASGFLSPGVLPMIVNPNRWEIVPDASLMESLQDGKVNILFVGRLSPHKSQDDLIKAFSVFRTFHPESRLILAGDTQQFDPFYRRVLTLIRELGLADAVMLTGMISDAQLLAYYRTAHLFWSMSEHEGFGVPAIEAMWFDIPVLAFRAAGTPETLGGAGMLFDEKTDATASARLALSLLNDNALRRRIINRQAQRRLDFLPSALWPLLQGLLERLTIAAGEKVGAEW